MGLTKFRPVLIPPTDHDLIPNLDRPPFTTRMQKAISSKNRTPLRPLIHPPIFTQLLQHRAFLSRPWFARRIIDIDTLTPPTVVFAFDLDSLMLIVEGLDRDFTPEVFLPRLLGTGDYDVWTEFEDVEGRGVFGETRLDGFHGGRGAD